MVAALGAVVKPFHHACPVLRSLERETIECVRVCGLGRQLYLWLHVYAG